MQNKDRKSFRTVNKSITLDEIVRVDHAGEYGAKRIYLGQLAVLKGDREITKMYEQELEHLRYFENEIKNRKVRPTILFPLWHIGAYAMGYASATLGREAAMTCTEAVEQVIGEHYAEQISHLSNTSETELKFNITQFRDEELEHHDSAILHGSHSARFHSFLKSTISTITKCAIALSKKW